MGWGFNIFARAESPAKEWSLRTSNPANDGVFTGMVVLDVEVGGLAQAPEEDMLRLRRRRDGKNCGASRCLCEVD